MSAIAPGLDLDQLRLHVVRPVLQYLQLYSLAAENLVVGTAWVESRARYVHQLGTGPAESIWQIEPATRKDILESWLPARYPGLAYRMRQLQITAPAGLNISELCGNLYFGAGLCRVFYYRVPEALPAADDPAAMAAYWKRHYNTAKGAGRVDAAALLFASVVGV